MAQSTHTVDSEALAQGPPDGSPVVPWGIRRGHVCPVQAPGADEDRVVAQLASALLYEKLVPFGIRPHQLTRVPLSRNELIFDRCLTFVLRGQTFRCLGAIGAFERVRILPGSVELLDLDDARPCHLGDLVEALEVDAATRERLRGELEQTVTLCRWNRENLPYLRHPRRHLDFQRLESRIIEGHPYHPCFKARTGFTLAEHCAYGPEAEGEFRLEWLAIPRNSLRLALPTDEASFLRQEHGDDVVDLLLARLELRGGHFRSHALLPVHPWQLASLRRQGLDGRGRVPGILALGVAGHFYRATQSVRTLVNVTDDTKANVKLPLDIVCTSSHRNFVEHFVCTAPLISDWVADLVRADPFLRERGYVGLLREYAAALLTTDDPELAGKLGVIYRESVCAQLAAGEAAVPFSALALLESDGQPFIAGWVAAYGAAAWVERLLEVVLVPLWHLLVHHGVAFESHAQNLILVHRAGWPTKVVLRDFHDTTEVVQDFLREPERFPDLAPIDAHFANVADDRGYRMSSTEDLRQLFMDTVYVFNLAEISFVFARHLGLPEKAFWEAVRRKLADYARSGVTEPGRIARIGCDAPEIAVESLLQKKLLAGGVFDFYEHRVANELHQ